jgi:hypothetical protein
MLITIIEFQKKSYTTIKYKFNIEIKYKFNIETFNFKKNFLEFANKKYFI